MQDIIGFVVRVVSVIVETCQQNILLQWSLYTFVFFSILFAFKVVFSTGRPEFRDHSKHEK